ncbi:MAG: sel1 repeat family protein [Myxococcales bacterium]|nr:sel1 repeat family protein [Myxococcales bacterium]
MSTMTHADEVDPKNAEHAWQAAGEVHPQTSEDWSVYFRLLRFAAKLGHPEAQKNLALWYLEGMQDESGREMFPRAPQRAIPLLRAAVSHGNERAMHDLAYCYDTGCGVRRDPERAMSLYRKAARRGVTISALNLAIMYREQENARGEERWNRHAVAIGKEEGNLDGVLELAKMALRDGWSDKRAKPVMASLRKLARQESDQCAPEAMLLLSEAHSRGIGVRHSKAIARRWLLKAAEAGDEDAIEALRQASQK